MRHEHVRCELFLQAINGDSYHLLHNRSFTTDVATLTVKDGWTVLSKMVNTPVSGNLNLSAYKDYYLDTTNYERWTYQYDSTGKLTKVLTPAADV